MFPGWWQILIVLILLLLLFGGRGRISAVMGDLARGIRSFREGMSGDDETGGGSPRPQVDQRPSEQTAEDTEKDKTSTS